MYHFGIFLLLTYNFCSYCWRIFLLLSRAGSYAFIYYLCSCGKWNVQCVSYLTWHVLHLLEPKQLQRSYVMWFFFFRGTLRMTQDSCIFLFFSLCRWHGSLFFLRMSSYSHVIRRYYIIIEGSLEVKLPTIWTDEKQSREEAERRERLEERRVEEKE